ncbi:MAG: DUF2934 domain-containing protein [Methylococcales bacterium]
MHHKSLLDLCVDEKSYHEFFPMVSVNAYYRAEKRGFEPGHELDDWCKAESEIIDIHRYWFKPEFDQ